MAPDQNHSIFIITTTTILSPHYNNNINNNNNNDNNNNNNNNDNNNNNLLIYKAPWYTDEIANAKYLRRKLEHKWLNSKLTVDYVTYKQQ